MEQVESKLPCLHCPFKGNIGGADEPNIHVDLAITAHPFNPPFFEDAEQFGLQAQRQFADFIEK